MANTLLPLLLAAAALATSPVAAAAAAAAAKPAATTATAATIVGATTQRVAPSIPTRELPSIDSYAQMSTQQLRDSFLIDKVFVPGEITLTYTTSSLDRLVLGGAVPLPGAAPLTLDASSADGGAGAAALDRRELAVFNIGPGSAKVTLDGNATYDLSAKEVLYVPLGTKTVAMAAAAAETSSSKGNATATSSPKLFLASAPCRAAFEAAVATTATAKTLRLGAPETANVRSLHQMIAPGVGPASCQLMVGLTTLQSGSVMNTMPPHRHLRRSEAYLYFGLPDDQRVFHFLGTPQETRHVVAANEQIALSPPWSIHAGAGTSAYSFVWVMAGENQSFSDMEAVPTATLM
jgi:4-deoxy-L-threo-5-hexosulose-uronate ketol-isomerase